MEGLHETAVGVAKPRRRGFIPFSFASRFVIDLLAFHPTSEASWNRAQWKPKHLLSVPKPEVLARLCGNEELHFSNNEQPLLTRDEALATVAEWNSSSKRKMRKEPDQKEFNWYFLIELGLSATAGPFAAVNHCDREFDLLKMRFRLVKPTAAEVAKYGKGKSDKPKPAIAFDNTPLGKLLNFDLEAWQRDEQTIWEIVCSQTSNVVTRHWYARSANDDLQEMIDRDGCEPGEYFIRERKCTLAPLS